MRVCGCGDEKGDDLGRRIGFQRADGVHAACQLRGDRACLNYLRLRVESLREKTMKVLNRSVHKESTLINNK